MLNPCAQITTHICFWALLVRLLDVMYCPYIVSYQLLNETNMCIIINNMFIIFSTKKCFITCIMNILSQIEKL